MRVRCECGDASGSVVWGLPVGYVELTACSVLSPRRAV